MEKLGVFIAVAVALWIHGPSWQEVFGSNSELASGTNHLEHAGDMHSIRYRTAQGLVHQYFLEIRSHWLLGAHVVGLDLHPRYWPIELWNEVIRVEKVHGNLIFQDNKGSWPAWFSKALPLHHSEHTPARKVAALCDFLQLVVRNEREVLEQLGLRWGQDKARRDWPTYEASFSNLFHFHSDSMALQLGMLFDAAAQEVLQALHETVRSSLPGEAGQPAVQEYARCFVDSGAHLLQTTNQVRHHAAATFSWVLPTPELVDWLCEQFSSTKRVISIGSGSCFLETAMHLRFVARGESVQIVCVEDFSEANNSEKERRPVFAVSPMSQVSATPSLEPGDALLISWGRQAWWHGTSTNVFTEAEEMAVHGHEVDTVVIIGGCDEQWYRSDMFGGSLLKGGCDVSHGPSTATHNHSVRWSPTRSTDHGVRMTNFWGLNDQAVVWTRLQP